MKKVVTKSSKDSVNESNAAARMPGKMTGRVIRKKTVVGRAPRSAPASSMARSKPLRRARMMTTTKGMFQATWAMSTSAKPGLKSPPKLKYR